MTSFNAFKLALIAAFLSSQVVAATTTTTVNTATPGTIDDSAVTTNNSIGVDRGALIAAIISDVQSKISQDPTFTGTDIAVTSQPGIILVLSGTVDTQAQVDAAISAAKAEPGVADVRSNLIVKGATPVTPGASTTTTTTSVTVPNQ